MHEILTSFIKVCHMVGFISLPAGLQFPVKWRLCLCEAYFVKQIFVKTFSEFINRIARNLNPLFVQYYTLVVFILYRLDTDFLLNDLFLIFSLDFQANLRPIGLLFVFVHIRARVLLDTLFNILGSKNYDHFLLQFVHISVHIC